ncbi:conserved protein of unknown function (plasmid) [Pararobbsia alpina]|uniref:hypothetical protein n=1 Tax=Pararobbsia alpina TaxID=621374 RepID=UPI0039A4142D
MPSKLRRNLLAQAEMLALVVVSELFVRRTTGQWMAVDELVECSNLYLVDRDDVIRRSMIASRAGIVAREIERVDALSVDHPDDLLEMFDYGVTLNRSHPRSLDVYTRCVAHLMETRWDL